MNFEELPNSEERVETDEPKKKDAFEILALIITFALFILVLLAIIAGCAWLIRYIW